MSHEIDLNDEYIEEETSDEEEEEEVVSDKYQSISDFFDGLDKLSADEIEDLFNKNTASFRCLAQILISRSSLLRHPLYHFPPLTDPGIDDVFEYAEPETAIDDVGLKMYEEKCKYFNIVCLKRIKRSLTQKQLNLKYYGLSTNQVRSIMEALKLNMHVHEVILQDNWMEIKAVTALSEALAVNKTITYLNISECRIKPEGAKILSEGISANQTLRDLDLSFNSLEDEGLSYLENALSDDMTIRRLNLSHNDLGKESLVYLGSILRSNHTIVDLDLSWNNLNNGPAMKQFYLGISKNSSIESLSFAWNGISTVDVTKWLNKYIAKSDCLKYFDISSNRLTGGSLRQIRNAIAVCKSIISVRIGSNIFNPEEALSLARIFIEKPKTTLQYLDMENMYVEKNFIPVWEAATEMGKSIKIGGIYSNYEIIGPDIPKLLFDRARFLAQSPKKKKQKKDFGHFILTLPEKMVTLTKFGELAKAFKMRKVDTDLITAIAKEFRPKKKVNLVLMKESYLGYWPDTKLPEKKPKKRKRKKKAAASTTDETATETATEATTDVSADQNVKEGEGAIPEGTEIDEIKTTEGVAKTVEGEETAIPEAGEQQTDAAETNLGEQDKETDGTKTVEGQDLDESRTTEEINVENKGETGEEAGKTETAVADEIQVATDGATTAENTEDANIAEESAPTDENKLEEQTETKAVSKTEVPVEKENNITEE